jgi:hypothetical protein
VLAEEGQFGKALVLCFKNNTQHAIILMENRYGKQLALLKVPLGMEDGNDFKLYEFDPARITEDFVTSGGYCAVDFERSGRAAVALPSAGFTERCMPKSGMWEPVVFWVVSARALMKLARFPHLLFFDGTFGVCNRDVMVMFPAALDSMKKHIQGGMVFFKS